MPATSTSTLRTAIVTLLGAAALAWALVPAAQSQVRATPSVLPVGVAASGSGSTAWFHDPASGRAIACHATASTVQCQSVRLPEGN